MARGPFPAPLERNAAPDIAWRSTAPSQALLSLCRGSQITSRACAKVVPPFRTRGGAATAPGLDIHSPCPAGAAVAMVQAVAAPLVRGFFVEANAKKSIGCTKEGTSRKRARVSGAWPELAEPTARLGLCNLRFVLLVSYLTGPLPPPPRRFPDADEDVAGAQGARTAPGPGEEEPGARLDGRWEGPVIVSRSNICWGPCAPVRGCNIAGPLDRV